MHHLESRDSGARVDRFGAGIDVKPRTGPRLESEIMVNQLYYAAEVEWQVR
jgi:hypothetical protein